MKALWGGISAVVVGLFLGWLMVRLRIEHEQMLVAQPCQDSAHLVATTAGSPNKAVCRVDQIASVEAKTAAGEEIGALVLCKCKEAP